MKSKYNFTTESFDKCKHDHYMPFVGELSKLEPITPWEDLQVGDVYHLPNMLIFKRADYIITEKKSTYINGMIRENGGNWRNHSLFKSEVRTKFLVKKIKINKD